MSSLNLRRGLLTLVAAFGVAGPAIAADPASTPATDARYQGQTAVCDGVQQDRAACIRESGAARQESQRKGLTHAPGSYDQNALARCQQQPVADRADCEARIRGTGASATGGSVMGGGVIRETVTPITAPAR